MEDSKSKKKRKKGQASFYRLRCMQVSHPRMDVALTHLLQALDHESITNSRFSHFSTGPWLHRTWWVMEASRHKPASLAESVSGYSYAVRESCKVNFGLDSRSLNYWATNYEAFFSHEIHSSVDTIFSVSSDKFFISSTQPVSHRTKAVGKDITPTWESLKSLPA